MRPCARICLCMCVLYLSDWLICGTFWTAEELMVQLETDGLSITLYPQANTHTLSLSLIHTHIYAWGHTHLCGSSHIGTHTHTPDSHMMEGIDFKSIVNPEETSFTIWVKCFSAILSPLMAKLAGAWISEGHGISSLCVIFLLKTKQACNFLKIYLSYLWGICSFHINNTVYFIYNTDGYLISLQKPEPKYLPDLFWQCNCICSSIFNSFFLNKVVQFTTTIFSCCFLVNVLQVQSLLGKWTAGSGFYLIYKAVAYSIGLSVLFIPNNW